MNKSATPHPPSAADRQSALNAFRQAFALHQRGMLAEAERLYLDVLTVLPNMSDALHFLGTLKAQRGDYEGAVGLIGRAILINPGDASAHYNLANALRDLNRQIGRAHV